MAGRPPIGERAMTAAERQRKRRDALRAQQPAQPKPKARADGPSKAAEGRAERDLAEARQEIRQELRRRIRELEQAGTAPRDADEKIARLEARLSEWEKFHTVYEIYLDEAERLIKARKGVLTASQFAALRRCLHPDTRKTQDNETLDRAFRVINSRKIAFLSEQQMPTKKPSTPAILFETMMRKREQAKEERKAKRRVKQA
jgi:hypothetical protein